MCDVSIRDLLVDVVPGVAPPDVAHVLAVPDDGLQPHQAHALAAVHREADLLPPRPGRPPLLERGAAEEVCVSLELGGEHEAGLHRAVVHPDLLVPVRVTLLYREAVNGSVPGVNHSVLPPNLYTIVITRCVPGHDGKAAHPVQRVVDGDAALPGDVQLPAHLPHEADPEGPHRMARNLDHLVAVEGEALVVQRGGGQLGQDVAAEGTLQRQHAHVLGLVLQSHVEALVLHRLGDVGQVLVGGAARGRDVEAALLLEAGVGDGAGAGLEHADGEVRLDAGLGVEHAGVGDLARVVVREDHGIVLERSSRVTSG